MRWVKFLLGCLVISLVVNLYFYFEIEQHKSTIIEMEEMRLEQSVIIDSLIWEMDKN